MVSCSACSGACRPSSASSALAAPTCPLKPGESRERRGATPRPGRTRASPHTAAQLATIAGIDSQAMRERLKRMPPEMAVAQGKAKFSPGSRRTFDIGGKPHTVPPRCEHTADLFGPAA